MRKIMMAAAFAAATATAPAIAQVDLTNSQGLVNVTIEENNIAILNDFLNETQLTALNNLDADVIVQVPIGIAANVCKVSAAVLGKSRATGGGCTAEQGSNALARAVTEQTLKQKYKKAN